MWPDAEQSLHEVGALLRRLRRIGRTFTPPPDARWRPWSLCTDAPGALTGHGNIAPWHVVFDGDRPTGPIGYGLPRHQRTDPIDRILHFVIEDNGWYVRYASRGSPSGTPTPKVCGPWPGGPVPPHGPWNINNSSSGQPPGDRLRARSRPAPTAAGAALRSG
ncbi:hypothetical protein [Nocardia brevicatena]|uniref:hypothetical protein n=1 Tax=Nocardia brevicatena TaxID=37327 RepID=UPI0002F4CF60|nr:hypothetical protein [Nocardia brevicatena]